MLPLYTPHCRQIEYDHTGRSNGRALVIFKRQEDAESAVAQFHKRTLDGAPMHVEIIEGPAPEARGAVVRGRGGGSGGGGGGGAPTWRGSWVLGFVVLLGGGLRCSVRGTC